MDSSFILPDLSSIRESQISALSLLDTDTSPDPAFHNFSPVLHDNGLYYISPPSATSSSVIWIPKISIDLQIRLLIMAHCSSGAHRGLSDTSSNLLSHVYWSGMEKDVKMFLSSCLQCRLNKGPRSTRAPWGDTYQPTAPLEALHMDFLFISNDSSYKYILVLRDGYSGFTWLFPSTSADSDICVQALLKWSSVLGIPQILISDQGMHFKAHVVAEFNRHLGIFHHFTLPHTPWSNGSIERINKDILSMFRCLLGELKLKYDRWIDFVPLIMFRINNSPQRRRSNYAPKEILLGQRRHSPLDSLDKIYNSSHKRFIKDFTFSANANVHIDALIEALQGIHSDVDVVYSHERNKRDALHSQSRSVSLPHFAIGDYVLMAYVDAPNSRHKLSAVWRGPYSVVNIVNNWVYQVRDLITNQISTVHVSRLRFYHDASLNVDADLIAHVLHSKGTVNYEKIKKHRQNSQSLVYEVLVKWLGFPSAEATWEPLLQAFQEAPSVVQAYISKKPLAVQAQLNAQLNIIA